ncbi:hypothetical protein CY0110_19417 [Crocosphaera chwakensis CCY0110]|uniref:Uncharacterized protein n=1 Tax=Crocosphaera chwakensis CCY0110 TaxID=391612 RepID=A3IJL5_9CHRO|nr:hypothetical protein CY0110_19417 [Crocosphaera chwakensis CCY0110]
MLLISFSALSSIPRLVGGTVKSSILIETPALVA